MKNLKISVVVLLLGLAGPLSTAKAAPDFKIRYNQKFPCLEVMDSKAVKITDVTEGAKGETVTSGKASITISFLKNAEGLPEVTLREAKSPLSEMEIEAFGLSVGLKPEGTVLVRFGADNKPKFEMDRTGGSRFLMADLGNLDTAAGKELTQGSGTEGAGDSKSLIRCRERFAAWKEDKGGWSNKSGKILRVGSGDTLKIGTQAPRELLEGEAVQVGGVVQVGPKEAIIFQSAAGVFHEALPGTVLVFSPLEAGSLDLKVELRQGTLLTYVAMPLVAPRSNLIVIADGVVARTGDALYQITKGTDGKSGISVASGKVVLADAAGGVERASLSGMQKIVYPKEMKVMTLAADTPEVSSLKSLPGLSRQVTLLDITQDGVAACPQAVEEIVTTAVTLSPECKVKLAAKAVILQPDALVSIRKATGIADLALPPAMVFSAAEFSKRADRGLEGEPNPLSQAGKILSVIGKITSKGQALEVGQILPIGASLSAGPRSQVMFLAAPGVVAELQENSEMIFTGSTSVFDQGKLTEAVAKLKTLLGDVHVAIVDGFGDKVRAEIETPKGLLKAKSSTASIVKKNKESASK